MKKSYEMETDDGRQQNTTAAFREGMGKQLSFLQDIAHDQRTQRHAMHMEYCILLDKCAEIIEEESRATSQGDPNHVIVAKLGDPVAFHALLARMYFLCQVAGTTLHNRAR